MTEWATRTRWRSGASNVTKPGGNRPGPDTAPQAAWVAPSVTSLAASLPEPSLSYTDASGSAVPASVAMAGVVELPLITATIQVDPTPIPASVVMPNPYWASGAAPAAWTGVAYVSAPTVNTGQGAIYMVPLSIDSTGVADVSADLRAFIATVPNNSVIRFQPGGQYRSEGIIHVLQRTGLDFDGNGARIFAATDGTEDTYRPPHQQTQWPRNRCQWLVEHSNNISIRNMEVQGSNPLGGPTGEFRASLEAQHAITVAGSTGVVIDDCYLHHVWGDGIYAAAGSTVYGPDPETGGAWRITRQLTITNSTTSNVSRQGIAPCWAEDVLIENNIIKAGRRSAIDLEPIGATWWVDRVTIRNNDIRDKRFNMVSSAAAGRVDNVLIEGNTSRYTGEWGSVNSAINIVAGPGETGTARRRNWIVRNNTGDRQEPSALPIMTFTSIDGVVVTGNTQNLRTSSSDTGIGVRTYSCCLIDVHTNSFYSSPPGIKPVVEWFDDPLGYVCP